MSKEIRYVDSYQYKRRYTLNNINLKICNFKHSCYNYSLVKLFNFAAQGRLLFSRIGSLTDTCKVWALCIIHFLSSWFSISICSSAYVKLASWKCCLRMNLYKKKAKNCTQWRTHTENSQVQQETAKCTPIVEELCLQNLAWIIQKRRSKDLEYH